MKNLICLILILLTFSCNEQQIDFRENMNQYNNIDLTCFNGKRIFYCLDSLNRLNYKTIYPDIHNDGSNVHIYGIFLTYKDSAMIEIHFDTLTFIPFRSRSIEYLADDSSWTPDNFLKEKIECLIIHYKKNGQFNHRTSSKFINKHPR